MHFHLNFLTPRITWFRWTLRVSMQLDVWFPKSLLHSNIHISDSNQRKQFSQISMYKALPALSLLERKLTCLLRSTDMGPSYMWVLFLTWTRKRSKIPAGKEEKTKTNEKRGKKTASRPHSQRLSPFLLISHVIMSLISVISAKQQTLIVNI